jgi:hypothetical protein
MGFRFSVVRKASSLLNSMISIPEVGKLVLFFNAPGYRCVKFGLVKHVLSPNYDPNFPNLPPEVSRGITACDAFLAKTV